ncbi:hypothetical protein DFH07DRAFT_955597 [Mycena maculata]|uniref:Uncharacterized protein n=1 Tax=Mycena maculata TaxID=230809 RepID=A0AAD7JMF3_9AGAR|nr:hypothetical protein DFH07DRAFT_955597 [Mycena maculata]
MQTDSMLGYSPVLLGIPAHCVTLTGVEPQEPDFSSFDPIPTLPPAYITQSQSIDLPAYCVSFVGNALECSTNMTALQVQFEDCGSGFTVCRCADAEMSMDTVLDRFGRVPVGLHRYAGTIIILSDTSPHVYNITTGQTHFFADVQMNSWVHEMMHAFDFSDPNMEMSAPGWAAAIAADSCVPDNYSLTNRVEDFAQVSVLKVYSLLYGGNLPPGTFELYNPGPLFGNNCDIVDNGPPASHTEPPAVLHPSQFLILFSESDTSLSSARLDAFRLFSQLAVDLNQI